MAKSKLFDEMRPAMEGGYDVEAELARAEAWVRDVRAVEDEMELGPGKEFFVPPNLIPPGFSYEWKRFETVGLPDKENMNTAHRAGWRAVPATRAGHEVLIGVNYSGDTIVKGGLMLMERPKVLTDAARLRENKEAQQALSDKEAQLHGGTPGTLTAREDARVTPRVHTSVHRPTEIPA